MLGSNPLLQVLRQVLLSAGYHIGRAGAIRDETLVMITIHDLPELPRVLEETVKKSGYAEISVRYMADYLTSKGRTPGMETVKAFGAELNLTAVRTGQWITFRRLMKPLDSGEIMRASGDARCDICGYAYKFHPTDQPPSEFLNVLCNGRRVKL